MEKEIITIEIFHKKDKKPIPYSVIKNIIQDDDIISAGFDEGYYSENESWDAHWFIKVERDRLETDEEFEKRKKQAEKRQKESKEKRYELYLKLKKEFEDV